MARKIPKKVLGVKIPKLFRKNKLLKSLLASQTGRQLMADALMAAATAAAGVLVAAKPQFVARAEKGVAEAGAAGSDVLKDAVKSAAAAVTDVIGNAAKAALPDIDKGRERTTPRPH